MLPGGMPGGQIPGYQPGMVPPPQPIRGLPQLPVNAGGMGQLNPQMLQAMMQLLQGWGGGGGGGGMYR